jgi:hypothetical protein
MRSHSVFLARLFGLGFTITAVWMLIDQASLRAVVQGFVNDRPLTFLLSLICIASGLTVVLGHQIWAGGIAQVLVTLVGWILLARGVVLLFPPLNLLESMAEAIAGSGWLYLAGVVPLILGLLLTYAGFSAGPIVSGGK